MVTLPAPTPGEPPTEEAGRAVQQMHRQRGMAESFGIDPAGYDRARPGYPDALVERIVNGSPGREVLDVGCGTGIAARQLRAAGCKVLGVEPDARMAAFARSGGLPVEVATFEAWEADGRMFDAVVAAQSWHWVDPATGPSKAATVLRAGGRLGVFGHVFEPPAEVAGPFAEAFRRVVPDAPFAARSAGSGDSGRPALDAYRAGYAAVAQQLASAGMFEQPEQWQFDWQRRYTTEQWLLLLPTTGGMTRLRPEQTAEILAVVRSAIDDLGGTFTMEFTTLAVSAVRRRS